MDKVQLTVDLKNMTAQRNSTLEEVEKMRTKMEELTQHMNTYRLKFENCQTQVSDLEHEVKTLCILVFRTQQLGACMCKLGAIHLALLMPSTGVHTCVETM